MSHQFFILVPHCIPHCDKNVTEYEMTENGYDPAALEGRVQQYGSFYQGMRQALAGESMPESIRQYAPQYALALTAARDLDQLPKGEAGTKHQS